MDDATRKLAAQKLDMIDNLIGETCILKEKRPRRLTTNVAQDTRTTGRTTRPCPSLAICS